jgi:hypothetical protein
MKTPEDGLNLERSSGSISALDIRTQHVDRGKGRGTGEGQLPSPGEKLPCNYAIQKSVIPSALY